MKKKLWNILLILCYDSNKKMNLQLPKLTELNDEQIAILNEVGAVAIYGGAGTGKTILSVWRHILNWEERNIKSFLITYTHTLTRYFELSIKSKSLKASQHIQNKDRFKNNPDIEMLIIDEAQDIPPEIHNIFSLNFPVISYGADNRQILYPDKSSTEAQLQEIYKNKSFYLTKNFRNSYEILQFVKKLFPNYQSGDFDENRKTGYKPILAYSYNREHRDNYLLKVLEYFQHHTIAILVPTNNDFKYYSNLLSNNNIIFTEYNNQQNGDIRYKEIHDIYLTTFKSSKGLEFDTVIIPDVHNFQYWSQKDSSSIINSNDYYVGMTRAKEKLIMLSEKKDIFNIDSQFYETEEI